MRRGRAIGRTERGGGRGARLAGAWLAPRDMSEHRANLRATFGHPDVIVHVDGSLDASAAWLPGYFADQVRSGVRFDPDQTIQVGWAILKLAPNPDGDLLVLEPDFVSMPIKWVEGASRSVRFIVLQRAVCEELGVESAFPSLPSATSVRPGPFPRNGPLHYDARTGGSSSLGLGIQAGGRRHIEISVALRSRACEPSDHSFPGVAVRFDRAARGYRVFRICRRATCVIAVERALSSARQG